MSDSKERKRGEEQSRHILSGWNDATKPKATGSRRNDGQ